MERIMLRIVGSVLKLWRVTGVAMAQVAHPHQPQMDTGKEAGLSVMANDARQALGV